MNELETKKKAPEYLSSISLIRILYEQKKISFEDYLIYFGYLTSYRFRFLSLNADDINKAVFGEGAIFNIKPQNIRNFNFPLTLSTEYGVAYNASFNLLLSFLFKIIMDDSVTVEVMESIYVELLYLLPEDKNKKEFGRMLINVAEDMIKNEYKIILSSSVKEKIKSLKIITDIFEDKLWLPNKQ